jgi:hypothetical protein
MQAAVHQQLPIPVYHPQQQAVNFHNFYFSSTVVALYLCIMSSFDVEHKKFIQKLFFPFLTKKIDIRWC